MTSVKAQASEWTYEDAYETLSDAEKALEEALQDVKTARQQADIALILSSVRAEKMQIVTRRLKHNTEKYQELTDEILAGKQKLDELSQELKDIIEAAEKAAKVAGAIARLLDMVAGIVL